MKKYGIVKFERTEEEKTRRRLHGDKGARFKSGKTPTIDRNGVCPAITTLVYKDISIFEIHEDNDVRSAR